MPRIAIIGGGIAGLSAAYELHRLGHTDFLLYEAAPRLGGIIETVHQDGFVIECGPDSWVTEKPWARELAIELGLEAELLPSNDAQRRTYLAHGDQLVPLPDGMRMMVPTDLEAIAASPLFSVSAVQAYRQEPSRADELKAFAAARSTGSDESVASFVQRHFGAEVTRTIAAPLLAGVFGGDIHRLSAHAVMAQFVAMEREHGSLVLGLQRRQRTPQPVFTTLRGGLQTLIERMAITLPPSAIRLREAVISISPIAGSWAVTTAAGTLSFDQVVLATPVHLTRKLLAPWCPELQPLLDIEATSSVVVALAFDREASRALTIPEGFGFLVPPLPPASSNAEPQLLACTFVDQKFTHRAPEACVLLRAFFGGASAAMLMGQPEASIVALARKQLAGLGLAGGLQLSSIHDRASGPTSLPPAQITVLRRWPRSLPQYAVGHLARVAQVESLIERMPGIHLLGNAFHGVGLPDLVRQGRWMANHLRGL